MLIVIIVPFRDEERYLGTLLETLAGQTRPPDRLVLVDDGSVDASPQKAARFVDQHPWARLERRPPRPRERDRLLTAPEWQSFLWALEGIEVAYDVVAKMDGDLRLSPDLLETIERHFDDDPRLGLTGAFLSARDRRGHLRREQHPVFHVRGATKFYRRACYEEIAPIPPMLGWDTIDEVKARMHGWRTLSFEIPSGDPEHLRPSGTLDGALRGFRRYGLATYAYGAHPLHVLLAAINRLRKWPWVLGGINYAAGWVSGTLRRYPRADPEIRAFVRREQLRRIGQRLKLSSAP